MFIPKLAEQWKYWKVKRVREAMRKRMRMKIIRKVKEVVLSFCQRPTELCLEGLKVAYDMRKG
jgi:hypothetical protein